MFRSKNSQASPEPKNSRQSHAAKNSPTAPDGRNHREPRMDERQDDATTEHNGGQSIEDIRQQLDEINRRRRGMIGRGVAAVVLPPVLLCIPFIVLKGCKLLLIPWGWTFAPLLLLLVPLVQAFRSYFAAVRAFRMQRDHSTGSQPDSQTEGAK